MRHIKTRRQSISPGIRRRKYEYGPLFKITSLSLSLSQERYFVNMHEVKRGGGWDGPRSFHSLPLLSAKNKVFSACPWKKVLLQQYSIVVTLSPLISGDEAENLVALTCLYSTVLYSTVRCTNLTISHICRTFIVERIYRYVVKY